MARVCGDGVGVRVLITNRFIIRRGIVGQKCRIVSAGAYFGEDMLLTNHIRNYAATSLSYLDVFCLRREDLMEELNSGKFPRLQVCVPLQGVSIPVHGRVVRVCACGWVGVRVHTYLIEPVCARNQ